MITLSAPDLGDLQLRAQPYTVESFQIGSRAVRAVVRNRALAHGTYDDTRFGGARAVTINIVLNEARCADGDNMQQLLDRLLPYTVPWRRSTMTWSLPGSGAERQMVVRGDSAPVAIAGNKHQAVVLSFVAPTGEITTPGQHCELILPADDTEQGRTYDLLYDRDYPASSAIGTRLIMHTGNEAAHWQATIFGDCINPYILINGVRMEFNVGGLILPPSQSLVIDTREKTIYLNGDPASPRFDRTNFAQWWWDDLLLRPGNNTLRFGAATLGPGASMNFCWRTTWAG